MTENLPTTSPRSTDLDQTADRGTYSGGVSRWSAEQRDVLRALMNAGDASDGDLDMLAVVCDRTGLDPFAKEVYLVGRRTKTGGYKGEPERWETVWSTQVSIEGFRKATHRFAAEKGAPVDIQKPVFYSADGTMVPFWSKSLGEHPEACEVTIRVGDSSATAVCTWDEYVQTVKGGAPNSMWRKMGPTMLRKCAEAAAHRMITPITSGLYLQEELAVVPAAAERVDKPARGAGGLRDALVSDPDPADSPRSTVDAGQVDESPVDRATAAIGRARSSSGLVKIIEGVADPAMGVTDTEVDGLLEVASSRSVALDLAVDDMAAVDEAVVAAATARGLA